MIKKIKFVSLLIIIFSCLYLIFFNLYSRYDVIIQNRIIDNAFSVGELPYDYLGYIDIPKFGIRRLIVHGTDKDVLDSLCVGMHDSSGDLFDSNLIILAGHNISNVFSKLHYIELGDDVFLRGKDIFRRFVVYDKKIVDEYDNSYFYNRSNELVLITCMDYDGYRLLVFLREVL